MQQGWVGVLEVCDEDEVAIDNRERDVVHAGQPHQAFDHDSVVEDVQCDEDTNIGDEDLEALPIIVDRSVRIKVTCELNVHMCVRLRISVTAMLAVQLTGLLR